MNHRRSLVRAPAASALLVLAVLAAILALLVDHRVSRDTLERTAVWRDELATIRGEASLARLNAEKRAAGDIRADVDGPLNGALEACDGLQAAAEFQKIDL